MVICTLKPAALAAQALTQRLAGNHTLRPNAVSLACQRQRTAARRLPGSAILASAGSSSRKQPAPAPATAQEAARDAKEVDLEVTVTGLEEKLASAWRLLVGTLIIMCFGTYIMLTGLDVSEADSCSFTEALVKVTTPGLSSLLSLLRWKSGAHALAQRVATGMAPQR